ncbi:MAG: hypothetical protein ABI579_05610 [Candidatus Sumerlaeota bacterium]
MHSTLIDNRFRRVFLKTSISVLLLAAAVCARAAMVPLSMEELVAVADQIVEVQVTESTSHPYQHMIVTTTKMQVIDRLKGDMKGEQSITYMGGKVGTLVMDAANVPQLHLNDHAILFLSKPYERLPKEMKSRYNAQSPLLNSYSIVGGIQGKFDIVDGDDKGTARVARGAVPGSVDGIDKAKTAEAATLKTSIRSLVTAQEAKARKKENFRAIKGIYGSFAVPDRSSDPSIRVFDPLPGMAYMSTDAIDAAVEASYSNASPSLGPVVGGGITPTQGSAPTAAGAIGATSSQVQDAAHHDTNGAHQ